MHFTGKLLLKNFIASVFSSKTYFNFFKSPSVNQLHSTDGLRLHLGAGTINIEGWINIDARSFNHIHLVSDNFELSHFTDNSVTEIYICHVLEHFIDSEVDHLLKIFSAKLCHGGVLYISVPDFHAISQSYLSSKSLSAVRGAILGGQDYEYNFHKSIFDFAYLTSKLKSFGFKNVSLWNPSTTFDSDLRDFSFHPYSLNVSATKS